jgi:hypothetical protein
MTALARAFFLGQAVAHERLKNSPWKAGRVGHQRFLRVSRHSALNEVICRIVADGLRLVFSIAEMICVAPS